VKLSQIKKNPDNPRIIRDEKFERLKKSLKDFPQMMALRPIVVDENGMALGGNMRLEALKANGLKEIPEEWVKKASDLTDEQKQEFIIKDNNSFGEYDWDVLANSWSDLPLAEWGVDIPEDWAPTVKVEEDESAVAEMVDRAAELQKKWKTKMGQLWEIPSNSAQGKSHRLLVGDSTNKAHVARLCANVAPSMVFCDPPYGVEIVSGEGTLRSNTVQPFGGKKRGSVGGTKPFGTEKGNGIEVGKYAPIIGDDTTQTALSAYSIAVGLFPRATQIWWGGNYYANALPPSSCWIVWDKENTGNFADAELAWTNQKTAVRIFKHMWNGLMKESERGQKRVHPTQKPIALGEWCFDKYGSEGDVILDQFLGSGMSMLAAENTARTVCGIEMSEDYCAVILERLSALGLTPKLTN
jgi:16S rRNA G966 N2-methylase RsmD